MDWYPLYNSLRIAAISTVAVFFLGIDRAEADATGVTAKGMRAIRLLAEGYSNREIGEQFGVPANYVTAWVAKARKVLKQQRDYEYSGALS